MDLLKSSELPAWLLERYGSASALAKALGTTRQTAHNLMTGRTIPSYETCKKLGLEPMFMQTMTRSSDEMDTLEDFLLKRSSQASKLEAEQAKVRLLNERASGAWVDLLEATRDRANRVGQVDGAGFEWHPYPSLFLGDVAATFSAGQVGGGKPQRFRVVFGRKPTGHYLVDEAPAAEAWNLELSVVGDETVWNINTAGVIGAAPSKVAEQIIRNLIEYWDKYQAFYSTGSWLTNRARFRHT